MSTYYSKAAYTPSFSRLTLDALKRDFDSDGNYYLVFSRSHPWTPTADYESPPDYQQEYKRTITTSKITPSVEQEIQNNAIVAIKASNFERYAGMRTSVVSGEDPYWARNNVVNEVDNILFLNTSNNRVYLPLTTTTSFTPSAALTSIEYDVDSGGSWWKYLFTLTADEVSRKVPKSTGGTDRYPLKVDTSVRAAAVKGQIVGYEIIDPGVNVSATPTLTILGDGTGARAVCSFDSDTGQITDVRPIGTATLGSGYTRASVRVTGANNGREPIIRPIITQGGGIGYDPGVDIQADTYVFNFSLGANDDLLDSMEYRTLAIVRNPTVYNAIADSDFTDSSGRAYTTIKVNSSGFAQRGQRVARTSYPFTQGYVIGVDSSLVHVYQNPDPFNEFGFTQGDQQYALNYGEDSWGSSGSIINIDTNTTANIVSVTKPNFDKRSGEVLYIVSNFARKLSTPTPTIAVTIKV